MKKIRHRQAISPQYSKDSQKQPVFKQVEDELCHQSIQTSKEDHIKNFFETLKNWADYTVFCIVQLPYYADTTAVVSNIGYSRLFPEKFWSYWFLYYKLSSLETSYVDEFSSSEILVYISTYRRCKSNCNIASQ